jgi:hypothetical protein
MNTSVYKIEFSKSSFELNEEYDLLSETEKEWISQMDADSFFDYDSQFGFYTCFLIAKPTEIKKYLEIMTNNFIENTCENLSKKILKNEVNLSEELSHLVNSFNSIKWSFFVEDLDEWILNNLDIDMVLDRISEVGIESLRPVEKEFLKNYQL